MFSFDLKNREIKRVDYLKGINQPVIYDGKSLRSVSLDERVFFGFNFDYHINGEGMKGFYNDLQNDIEERVRSVDELVDVNGIYFPNGFPSEDSRGSFTYILCKYYPGNVSFE